MSNRVSLKAASRASLGRTAVKKSRAEGKIPAVLYGGRKEPQPLELNRVDLAKALHGSTSENILVDLEVQDAANKTSKRLALIQDVQHDSLRDLILHIDLLEIDENKKLHVEVPVIEVGEAAGVKLGGLLDHALRTIRVECLPKDLPDKIEVDVSALEIGQAIHVGDIALPPGVVAMNAKDLPVFMVHAPTVAEETAPAAAGAEQAQPEVIKEKKDDAAKAE
jgi:large subunit ribosomal protein L25